ncbi:MAG: hypothetical protein J0L69_15475 [Bacteroidetes bacterium]|nr:hypothetical protein [Bacteroidota bacterium]
MFRSADIKSHLKFALSLYAGFWIAVYGFVKVVSIQFAPPEKLASKVLGDLTGMELTWYYFGYSGSYTIIIGLLQMAGSLLLIINRTRIIGALMLFPIMLNIVFIDYFYRVTLGAFGNAIFYTLILLFILYLEREKLFNAFRNLTLKITSQTSDSIWKKIGFSGLFIIAAIVLNQLTINILIGIYSLCEKL